MKTFTCSLIAAALGLASMSAWAAPWAIEGELRSVSVTAGTAAAPTTVVVNCAGMTVAVTAATQLKSINKIITMAQMVDPTPFYRAGWKPSGVQPIVGAVTAATPITPATERAGFVGGTCVMSGDDVNRVGLIPLATAMMVNPSENVVVGTRSPGAVFAINGVPVMGNLDPRVPGWQAAAGLYPATVGPAGGITAVGAHPASACPGSPLTCAYNEWVTNAFGFGVIPSTVPAGDAMAANGYVGWDGTLYAYLVNSTGGDVANASARPSIQRAQCLNLPGAGADSVTVRGSCILPTGVTSAVIGLVGVNAQGTVTQNFGQAVCTQRQAPVAPNPGFGNWTYAGKGLTMVGDACPAKLAASISVGATTYPRADLVAPDVR